MCLKPARVGIVATKALDGFNTIDQTGRDQTLQGTGEVLYKENAKIDSKADIYSLGIILVEVVDPLNLWERHSVLTSLKRK